MASPPAAAAPSHDNFLKWISLIALVGQNCAAVMLMSITQERPMSERYSPVVVVWMCELLKLIICGVGQLRTAMITSPSFAVAVTEVKRDVCREMLPVAVPAVLYALQNNLLFVALSNLDPTVFQVTYQLKLLCTALLMVLMLNKQLSLLKWIALVLLFGGIVLTQLDSSSRSKRKFDGAEVSFVAGMTAVVVCAFSSGFASVYFEKVLKGSTTGLFVRNIQLSICSIAVLALFYVGSNAFSKSSPAASAPAVPVAVSPPTTLRGDFKGGDASASRGIFFGFDALVWGLVLNQALGGILVAMVIKYADNILKVFATTLAIIFSAVLSALFFNFDPSLLFLFGAAVVLVATALYSLTA